MAALPARQGFGKFCRFPARMICDMLRVMNVISILVLGHPQPRDSGDWLHRADWPAKALGGYARVETIQTLHPQWVQRALAADVLVILMIVDPILAEIVAQRRRAGRATVYEISDDFTSVATANPLAPFYRRPEVQNLIRQLAGQADAVQFSSRFLSGKFSALNPRTKVFLNQLNEIRAPVERGGNRPLRIGWAGSLGHLEDARLLAQWIGHWPHHDQVQWCLMSAKPIAAVFREAGVAVSLRPTGSMDAYLEFLAELDAGLAWVGNDDFSRGRSDGKFLEYASCGVLPVCRNSPVYAATMVDGETGMLFENEVDLHRVLDRLLEDPAATRQMGCRAYEHVAAQRTHAVSSPARLHFYEELTTLRSGDAPGYASLIAAIEPDLCAGMELVNAGRSEEALNRVLPVMEQAPEFFFVWQVLETICQKLGREDEARQCAHKKIALLHRDLPF